MSDRTATPSVPCGMQQSGPRQASPCHDVVKPTYFWPTMTSRPFDKPCRHGIFNAVMRLSHHVAKVSQFARSDMTQSYLSLFSSVYTYSVAISFVQRTRNSLLIHLFSNAWIHRSSLFLNVVTVIIVSPAHPHFEERCRSRRSLICVAWRDASVRSFAETTHNK